jgi:hypothetical protein
VDINLANGLANWVMVARFAWGSLKAPEDGSKFNSKAQAKHLTPEWVTAGLFCAPAFENIFAAKPWQVLAYLQLERFALQAHHSECCERNSKQHPS